MQKPIEFTRCEKKPKVKYQPHPKFGTVFAPHMLQLRFSTENETETLKAEIVPFSAQPMSPATIALHYGQTIFEGLKIFRQKDGSVAAFRADRHAARFMVSAKKMAMPSIGEDVFMKCLTEYMHFEEESVPQEPDHALYIRPMQFGCDEQIKVGRSKKYVFYIIASIAGSYFSGGHAKPARVLVNREFVRAFPGGLGEAKTAANYAASLAPQAHAETLGCDQVLYLDAVRHEFIDELGGMNFFIVRNGDLITPSLNGAILPGVTRQSILEMASSLGLKASEEKISFPTLLKDIQSGAVTETFACGTAAVVHSIGELVVQETKSSSAQTIKLPDSSPVAGQIYESLKGMQRGHIKAPGNWLFK